ncbi:hypothetical protein LCGC14_1670360 [marine sediment metagenome]|uniref:Uncharacterized protein n=1 Tax=marine sediment metagenome TaxID=412755 RepID=A0A0F9HRH1_9ZZZZ
MKYTKSTDGKERANVNITIRLSRDDYAQLKKDIDVLSDNKSSLRDYLTDTLYNQIAMVISDQADEERKYIARKSEEIRKAKENGEYFTINKTLIMFTGEMWKASNNKRTNFFSDKKSAVKWAVQQ